MNAKVRMNNATYELLMEVAKRTKRDPSDLLSKLITMWVAGRHELDAILPDEKCEDPRAVLAIVRQLSGADPSTPVTIEIPPSVTGGEPIRAHRFPVGV